jgi:hypothetical protein
LPRSRSETSAKRICGFLETGVAVPIIVSNASFPLVAGTQSQLEATVRWTPPCGALPLGLRDSFRSTFGRVSKIPSGIELAFGSIHLSRLDLQLQK